MNDIDNNIIVTTMTLLCCVRMFDDHDIVLDIGHGVPDEQGDDNMVALKFSYAGPTARDREVRLVEPRQPW